MNMKDVEVIVRKSSNGGVHADSSVHFITRKYKETITVNLDHVVCIQKRDNSYMYEMVNGTTYESDYDWFDTQESAPTVDTREASYLKYDKGLGGTPEILDRVEICYTNSNLDTKTGLITGWSTLDHQIAIVTLDYAMKDDVSTVAIPAVCLKYIP